MAGDQEESGLVKKLVESDCGWRQDFEGHASSLPSNGRGDQWGRGPDLPPLCTRLQRAGPVGRNHGEDRGASIPTWFF